MSGQEAGLNQELKQAIEAFQKEMLPNIPSEIVSTLQRTTEDLVKSGIADRSVKVGDPAPAFTLPNVRGEDVSLANLLSKGPVVLAFYRGTW